MLKQVIAGAVILVLAALAAHYYWPEEPPVCQICRRPMHRTTSCLVTLENGQEVELCCPRCGLRFLDGREDVLSVEVTSYADQQLLPASEAFYVVGSSVHPCCSEAEILKDWSGIEYELTWDRCLPSVIAFSAREEAEAFRSQHGGELSTYRGLKTAD